MTHSSASWREPAEPAVVGRFRAAASRFAEAAGFEQPVIDDVRLCVSEAVTNALVHAFRDKPSGAHVALLVERDEDTLIIHVRDNGSGFAPRTDSPGLGIGIPTIAALTSSMSVGTSPIGGTELCMEFSR